MALNKNLQKLKTLVSLHDEAKEGKQYATKAEWTLATLQQIVSILDQGLTKEEFTTAFKALNDYVKKVRDTLVEINKKDLERIESSLTSSVKGVETKTGDAIAKLKSEIDDILSNVRLTHEAMVAEAQAKLDAVRDGEDGKDGMDADEEEIVKMVLSQIPKPEQTDLVPIEEKIEALDKKVSSIRTAPLIGPSRGVYLYINGVKKGLINALDIVGSGVATSVVNGLLTITITGGAGNGVNIETPSGTVNGTNLSFNVSNEPKYIIVDGVSKFVTTHYTYSGGTITLLADNSPSQFIRSVY